MTHTNQERAKFLGLLDGTTEFMKHAGQNVDGGQWTDNDVRDLRFDILHEEFDEYIDGEDNEDLVATVDALLDVIVVAWGSLLAYVGEDKAKAAAAEVVRSNLDKVVGEGLPILREDGKVLKPEGWRGPDIASVISQ